MRVHRASLLDGTRASRRLRGIAQAATAFLRSCLATPLNAALTIAVGVPLVFVLPSMIDWAVLDAVWAGSSSRACEGKDAACWVFIRLRFDQILYGSYPASERWRADLVFLIALLYVVLLLLPGRKAKAPLAIGMLCLLPCVAAPVLIGGILGLAPVPTVQWGGLLVTFVVAVWAITTAIPLGLVLALGRRSTLPVIATMFAVFIDLWRSLPLIGVLFLAIVMFPLFVPPGVEVDKLLRVLIAFTLFNAAYFSEVFRGGLQAIPAGQFEAARSLGLGFWRTLALVVLPQVIKITLPGIVNTCVSIIKETTVIFVVGLVEFLAVLQFAIGDPEWLIGDQVRATAYLFAGLVFWSLCFGTSRYSAHLERTMQYRESAMLPPRRR